MICIFEPSGWSKEDFHAVAFIQPLYIPVDYLFFNIGFDFAEALDRAQLWWKYDPSTIADTMAEVLHITCKKVDPWFFQMQTPRDYVAYVERSPYHGINEQQWIVYSWILAGDTAHAMQSYQEIETFFAHMEEPIYDWVYERFAECMAMKELFVRSPDEARERLLQYRQQTLTGLRLAEYAVALT